MPAPKWNEDIRAGSVVAYGEALGPLYDVLLSEPLWLHQKCFEYRELFGAGEDRIGSLNGTAPYVIQNVLWEDSLLHVASH
jgi:hypothetical protein